jgi:hypothetical protein
MDAKTRYRRRLKLQAALGRVMEMLAHNVAGRIPPDRKTSLLAGQMIQALLCFGSEAGLTENELHPPEPGLDRSLDLKRARKRETSARYRQRKRQQGRRA